MLEIGELIPDTHLLNQNGELIKVNDFIGKNYLVVYFYPKDDTPGCTAEACSFRDSFDDFVDAGALVFGISSDDVESHKQFHEKYRLNFDLLSDEDGSVRKAYGVKGNLLGLLPGRVTFIFDKEGLLIHSFSSQLNPKKHIDEALKAIEAS